MIMIVALCTFLAVSAAPTLGQDSEGPTLVSPCPDVFTYLALGPDFDRWYGVINVTIDQLPRSLTMIFIELDEWDGPNRELLTILDPPDNMTSENSNIQSNPGFTEMVYFSVQYDPQKITPRLTSILLNCTEICNINKTYSAVMGTSSNSTILQPVALWCNSDVLTDRFGSYFSTRAALKILQSPRSTNSKSVDAPRQCGKVTSSKLPPINDILPILKNQWPWQVALHLQSRNVRQLNVRDYICGGTLITARHVITAAQCVTRRLEEPKPMVFLGKHNLKTSVERVQIRGVSDIFIHPDYNASTHSTDVAILELDAPLKYSDWVRPACLWPDNDVNLKNVVGKKGLLLSWRFDSENQVKEELSQEEITMVSQETCGNFSMRSTSEYTYCAENKEENSSCPSIGSGMVFKKDSTWYLRGLLSSSVPQQNRCGSAHYAVFTDLAKFSKWIDSIVIPLYTCLALLAAPTLEQEFDSSLISPCPDVFTYELPRADPHRWFGVIKLTTDSTLYSLWVNILFDDKVDILGNWLGEVTTDDNKNFKIQDTEIVIKPGPATKLRFFVQYRNTRAPRLLAIRLNGREICSAANSKKPISWFLSNGRPVNKETEPPSPVYVMSRGTLIINGTPLDRTIDAALRFLQFPKSTNPKGVDGQPLCGKVVENHWPWQIALYQDEVERDKYICGGTLVTARHIITAAHCVTKKSTGLVVNRHTLAVFLGKHDLWKSIDGVQVKYVKDIKVHPHYNASTYTRNVAILELNQPVTYTDWVRPACLWPKNEIDLKNVIGKKGLVLSWGFDSKDKVINDLHQEEMPVVSQATCNNSGIKFVQSEYTYCAGNRDERSPCAGAGSGMVFKIGSTWHLRGLTSLAASGYSGKRCDTSYYVVFTDLAKFLPWIYDNVFDF